MTYTTRSTCPRCGPLRLVCVTFPRGAQRTTANARPVYHECSRCNPPKRGEGAYALRNSNATLTGNQ